MAFLFLLAVAGVNAQSNGAEQSRPSAENEDYPKGIKESLAKHRIEREKKDYEELLQRGEEAAKLSDELDKSFVQNKSLTNEDLRKLERLEKLSKKIREELGASDSDFSENKTIYKSDDADVVSSVSDAVKKLKNISLKLSEELKKTTRYTISAVALQSSNTFLKIVRFIRLKKN